MRTLYIFLFINVISVLSYSQELNFNDMIYLHTNRQDMDKCDSYLEKKNFIFFTISDKKYHFRQKNINTKIYAAEIWIGTESLTLTSYYRQTYDYYRQIALNNGFKLEKSGDDGIGNLRFIYINDKYYLALIQVPLKDDQVKVAYMIYLSSLAKK